MANLYLDYAATTPLLPAVQSRMADVMAELVAAEIGNPASLHAAGQRGRQILETARLAVAQLINARPSEIIFTSGGTESNNTVAHIFAGQKVAVSAIEHPSVTAACQAYAQECVILPVDAAGRITELPPQSQVALYSIMLANNELGTIEPITKLAQQAHNQGSLFHTDATQAVGKIAVDVQELGVDYLTFSAHKIGGPVGIGVLYVKTGAPYQSLLFGGHQEDGRRAGTSNALLASGLAVATDVARDNLAKYQHVASLRDQLSALIVKQIPSSIINTPVHDTLPHILNVSFPAAEGESTQLYLDLAGIRVSTGSACASASLQPSPVLMAISRDPERAHNSIRFSLGPDTTLADIDKVSKTLPDIIKRLQGISTIQVQEEHD